MGRRRQRRSSKFWDRLGFIEDVFEIFYYMGRGMMWLFRLVFKLFD